MLGKISTTFIAALALLLPSLQAGPSSKTTDFHKAAEVASLMDRVESNAIDMRAQAARLRSYTRAPQQYSWQLHAEELNRISGELDRVAGLIDELMPMKPVMTYRQAAAFNHLISLSAQVSTVTEEAIAIVNQEKAKLRVAHPDYEKKVNAIYDHADMIASHADTVEDWAELIENIQDATDD